MKKIKDAARNIFDRLSIAGYNEDEVVFTGAFKIGIEFAQRWIPIEEELPSEENEFLNVPVITITGYGNYRITNYDGIKWSSDEIITFWRPIELN